MCYCMQHGSPAKQKSTKKHPAFALLLLPLLLNRFIGFFQFIFPLTVGNWHLSAMRRGCRKVIEPYLSLPLNKSVHLRTKSGDKITAVFLISKFIFDFLKIFIKNIVK